MKSEYLNRKAQTAGGNAPNLGAIVSDLAEIKGALKQIADSVELSESGYKDNNASCKHLGCSPDTLERKVKQGILPKYYLGTKPVYKVADLNRLPTLSPKTLAVPKAPSKPEGAGNDNGNPGDGKPQAGEPEAA